MHHVAQTFIDFLPHVIPETGRGPEVEDSWQHVPGYVSELGDNY